MLVSLYRGFLFSTMQRVEHVLTSQGQELDEFQCEFRNYLFKHPKRKKSFRDISELRNRRAILRALVFSGISFGDSNFAGE
jgi:hypothetical protein